MLACALVLATLQAGGSFAAVRNLQLPAGWRPTSAALADCTGDGQEDVVIAAHERGKPFRRELQIWNSVAGGASFALGERFAVTPDVVAWCVGDVREGGGAELVLFTASGVFSWRPTGPPDQRLERLAEVDFLWQLPEPDQTFHIEHLVRDVDGDGLDDVVAPGPKGYTVLLQRRPRPAGGGFGNVSSVEVPRDQEEDGPWLSASSSEGASVRGRRSEGELSLRIDDDDYEEDLERTPAMLVQVNESVPMPQWVDWDGDGRLDLVAQTPRRLHVWRQGSDGTFSAAPQESLSLPVQIDRARRLDASFSAHVADLDGDRRADYVVFAGDKRAEDVRTQGLFFTHRAAKEGPSPFGASGRPSDLLVFAGFVSSPSFLDLDGDGLPDLSLRAVRPDLIDQLRSATNEAIEAELYVYRNQGGRLSKQPDLVWRHSIPIKRFQLTSRFCGDLTGDRISELLVRDSPQELRVLMVRPGARGAPWSVLDKPLWKLAIDPAADVALVPAARGGKPRVLVIEPNQVLQVRFP